MDRQLYLSYAPCSPLSRFHDLACGHRIRTQYQEACGANCLSSAEDYPFICSECVATQVTLELELSDLSLEHSLFSHNDHCATQDATRSPREGIQSFVEQQVSSLKIQQHRPGTVVPKLDPLLQFYNDFPEAQEDGGFCDPPTGTSPPRQTTIHYKRPHRRAARRSVSLNPSGTFAISRQNNDQYSNMHKPLNVQAHPGPSYSNTDRLSLAKPSEHNRQNRRRQKNMSLSYLDSNVHSEQDFSPSMNGPSIPMGHGDVDHRDEVTKAVMEALERLALSEQRVVNH